MPNEQWKKRERTIGKRLGTQRIPSSGRATPDLRLPPGEAKPHNGLAIESKCWSGIQPRFWDALVQARKNASDNEVPVAIISESNRVKGRTPRFAVVMDFDAFCELFGPDQDTTLAIEAIAEEDK